MYLDCAPIQQNNHTDDDRRWKALTDASCVIIVERHRCRRHASLWHEERWSSIVTGLGVRGGPTVNCDQAKELRLDLPLCTKWWVRRSKVLIQTLCSSYYHGQGQGQAASWKTAQVFDPHDLFNRLISLALVLTSGGGDGLPISLYLTYVRRHYMKRADHVCVVFDSYREIPTTKDCVHILCPVATK